MDDPAVQDAEEVAELSRLAFRASEFWKVLRGAGLPDSIADEAVLNFLWLNQQEDE